MKKTIFLAIGCAFICTTILWSCGNNSPENNGSQEQHEISSATFQNVDAAITVQINQIVEQYIHLKNGLVASNMDEAKEGAKGILDVANTTDVSKLSSEQKAVFDTQIMKIKENAQHIIETDKLEHQREHLGSLTDGIYEIVKSFGGGKILYYDFCPMANNSNGGYWISESEEIQNPYFGDEMLSCGETKETIR